MRILLRIAKRVANKVFGTLSDALFWRFRHLFDRTWPEKYVSESSLNHPHRKLLVEKILKYSPKTVLEVGCASGPNLVLLARSVPQAELTGTDISRRAVEAGRKYLELQKIKNVNLEVGNVLNLKKFPDKSYEVVFTDATLIYVDENKIEGVLKELIRITKKAVVLNEWLTESKKSAYVGHWAHNYKNFFKNIAPKAEVKLTKITTETWIGDWSKYGYIIEVVLPH